MAKLTKKEQAWLDELQAVLNRCPSKRIGFYTIGDKDVYVYDRSKDSQISSYLDRRGSADFCTATRALDADFTSINFPAAVHSTAG